jgi:hypothetical protein
MVSVSERLVQRGEFIRGKHSDYDHRSAQSPSASNRGSGKFSSLIRPNLPVQFAVELFRVRP